MTKRDHSDSDKFSALLRLAADHKRGAPEHAVLIDAACDYGSLHAEAAKLAQIEREIIRCKKGNRQRVAAGSMTKETSAAEVAVLTAIARDYRAIMTAEHLDEQQ